MVTKGRGETMGRRRSARRWTTGRALALLIGTSVPMAAGDWREASPRPGPDVTDARPRCLATLGGHVERLVGNVIHGPSRRVGVPRLSVVLLDGEGRVVARTRTDRAGAYSFRGVCAGRLEVCAGTPCPAGGAVPSRFSPETLSVRVPPLAQAGLDFLMLEPPPLGIDDPGL